jgi:hypothetical protein
VTCSQCHNDWGVRRPLSIMTNFKAPLSRLPIWIAEISVHQNMPPGKTLSPDNWEKAKSLLLKEQQEAIRYWIDSKKCVPTTSEPLPASKHDMVR